MKRFILAVLAILALAAPALAGGGRSGHWSGWSRRAWRRTDAPGLLWAFDPKIATMGATPLASGTTPPALTLSGTLTTPYGLRVEITTGGARGTALFRISLNNGTSFVASSQTTAATYTVTGTSVVLNFPTGTYATDNVYQATIATWPDMLGHGLNLTQATASKQPLYLAAGGPGGTPALQFDGVDDAMNTALDSTRSQPAQVWMVTKWSGAATGTIFDGFNVNHMRFYRDTSTRLNLLAGFNISGTGDPSNFHYYQLDLNNTSSQAKADNAQIMSGTAGANTPDGVTIGQLPTSSSTACIIESVVVFNALANSTDAAAIVAAIKAETGL
jgi:hypothetical protein